MLLPIFLYNIFLFLYKAGVSVASTFNPKARSWLKGRKNLFERLQEVISPGEKIIWVHCASLGEFEQGLPVIESLKPKFPSYRILLTFFSPSGFEAKKDFGGVDWVFYLPLDGPRRARRFLEIVHPSIAIFVKYEFWYYFLKKIKYRKIPLILVSALFRKDMSFFKWYGGLQKKMLSRFDHLFVQNESSFQLMKSIGLENITTISGDTRYDRVVQIASVDETLPLIEKFILHGKTIIAGSTWPEDELLLQNLLPYLHSRSLRLIIAPHEISFRHITELKERFKDVLLYSELEKSEGQDPSSTMVIDNIGMLSRLYKYGFCCYVGGGFKTMGVHNVLEPAVYGKPVLMGPHYQKYAEATELLAAGGGKSVADHNAVIEILDLFLTDENAYRRVCMSAAQYVRQHAGATGKIISFIQENRLLTS
jgi:3-deoxy-D-manno-octulosonic-acid transferase